MRQREPVWPGVVAMFGLGAVCGFLVRQGFAFKRELSAFATKDEVVKPSDAEAFARWTDLPDVSQFVTEDALTVFAQKTELPDLSRYALKSDVADLTRSALQAEPALGSLAQADHLRRALDQRDREIADLRESLARERAERADALERVEARLAALLARSSTSA